VLDSNQIAQAQKNARLMGILYGLIRGHEMQNVPVSYDSIKADMLQHCTERELLAVFKELTRYSNVVQSIAP
jgi:hypothetical protein